ncbi:chorismate mutase [Streptomyces sp. NPDC001985]|uniref:chorismate mutase n=1 Tax=Streptomyces sp. NPDC001985 TaxID=3154406 RepID=UPI00331CBB6A
MSLHIPLLALTAGLLVITAMVTALVLSGTSGGPRDRPAGPPGRLRDHHPRPVAPRTADGGETVTRAIRGATQVARNDRESILEATTELLAELMRRNGLTTGDVVSVLFTATPDLTAEVPALAARRAGFHDVPLLCAAEIDLPGALPRVVRLMVYADIERARTGIRPVYLRGTAEPRQDLMG